MPGSRSGGPSPGAAGEPTDPERDPSLAAERTQLAWNRSGLAVLGALAIVARRLWPLHGTSASVVVAVTAAGGLTWAVGMYLTQHSPDGDPGRRRVHARTLTGGTLLLAAAALALSLTS